MNKTGIAYADFTWNPFVGCERVSPGCRECYAERLASTRLRHLPAYQAVTNDRGWNGKIHLMPERLDEPLRRRRPATIFLGDMGDVFHEGVPFEYIAAVFGVMAACPQHQFLVLTKRPERMLEFFTKYMPKLAEDCRGVTHAPCMHEAAIRAAVDNIPGGKNVHTMLKPAWDRMRVTQDSEDFGSLWPLPNVFLGVTCEDQQRAKRIPLLLKCPAAVHWVSAEPLLEEIDFTEWLGGHYARNAKGREHNPSDNSGMDRSQTGRLYLESGTAKKEPMGRDCNCKENAPASNRRSGWCGVQNSQVHGGRQTELCPGASCGLVVVSRPDPIRDASQSQEREQVGQPTGELGTGNGIGEHQTCRACVEDWKDGEPRRGEEPRIQVDRRTGTEDSRTLCRREMHASRASSGVWGPTSGDITDCSRGQSEETIRAHSELRSKQMEGNSATQRVGPIHLVICGGESGSRARHFAYEWAIDIRNQCRNAGAKFFMKQAGARPYVENWNLWDLPDGQMGYPIDRSPIAACEVKLRHRAGADPSEWPWDLRVREWPVEVK